MIPMIRMCSVLFSTAALCLVAPSASHAQTTDDSEVVLPLEAQSCNLPNAPARVAEDADYDALVVARGRLSEFQAALTDFRSCLDASREHGMLTEGNEIALTNAHNYSVEMETRVAEQYNIAVRNYKARQSGN